MSCTSRAKRINLANRGKQIQFLQSRTKVPSSETRKRPSGGRHEASQSSKTTHSSKYQASSETRRKRRGVSFKFVNPHGTMPLTTETTTHGGNRTHCTRRGNGLGHPARSVNAPPGCGLRKCRTLTFMLTHDMIHIAPTCLLVPRCFGY
jgi:hypothetical protein